jgi:nitrogenase molybdenum-iron protein NifN
MVVGGGPPSDISVGLSRTIGIGRNHTFVFGKRAVIYGESDLVIGLTAFLCEIGATPVLCICGGKGRFENTLRSVVPELPAETINTTTTMNIPEPKDP